MHPGPPRPESIRGQTILYSILLPRCRHCGCIPQSLRWRVLDPRTGEAQAADLGYVVGCTSHEARSGGRLWQKEMAYWGVLSFLSEAREVLIAVDTVQL